jgi:AraC-like DNA-binding protein
MKKEKRVYPLRKEVDFAILERLLAVQSTGEEIASFFGISYNHLVRRCRGHYGKTFEDVAKDMRNRGKSTLRLTQMKTAQGYALTETQMEPDGRVVELHKDLPASVPMLIHLGKHILGQKDDGEGGTLTKLVIEHVVTEKPDKDGNGEGLK